MSKHTPGPWAYQLGSIVDSEGYLIADVRSRFDDGLDGEDYHHTNAALLAAAPELLAALVEFSGVWERGLTFAAMDVDAIEAMRRRARAAIAQATGDQS